MSLEFRVSPEVGVIAQKKNPIGILGVQLF